MSTAILLGPGSVVGGEYTIRAPLEEGGMGAVYLAEQRTTGKLRALELMRREIVADPAFQRRFEEEARVASRIRSEHVVDVLAAGVDGSTGLPFLVSGGAVGEGPAPPRRRRGCTPANSDGGTTAQLLREIVLDPFPAASTRAREQGLEHLLPEGFDGWFARCVERAPEHRFADAEALWRVMAALFGEATHVTTREALAETFVATADSVLVVRAAETGEATAFQAPSPGESASAPPIAEDASPKSHELAGGTPLESVTDLPRAAPPATSSNSRTSSTSSSTSSSGRRAIVLGVVNAAPGIGVGAYVARGDRATRIDIQSAPAPAVAPAAASAFAPAPRTSGSASADAPSTLSGGPGSAVASSAPPARAASAPPPSSSPWRAAVAGGFADPTDRNGAVTWKVQDHHVRLFTRLVSNESNVAHAVVRKALEWSSWEYLRCYERAFGGAKDLPEGTATVGFDILDQLPRHAALVSSTILSATFNDCVVRTLVGQTINAAGPDDRGHVVHAFRFVRNGPSRC